MSGQLFHCLANIQETRRFPFMTEFSKFLYIMNIPKLAERYLLLKNSLTRNIQQVFVTRKSLKMVMKTKGFMIRIRDELCSSKSRGAKQSSIFPNLQGTGKPSQLLQFYDYYLLGPQQLYVRTVEVVLSNSSLKFVTQTLIPHFHFLQNPGE